MKTRPLGKTGLNVSELSLGGLYVASFLNSQEAANQTLVSALRQGVNYLDTAPAYGNSEEALGRALKAAVGDSKEPLIISTKLGGRPTPFNPRDPAGLRQSVDESLRLLGRDSVDILIIHEPDRPAQYDWWRDFSKADGPVMEVMDDLKKAGKIRFTGLGGTTAYEMATLIRTGKFDAVLTAFQYSALWREAEHEIFPACRETGIGVIVGSPLQQGALSKKYDLDRCWFISPQRKRQFLDLYHLADDSGMTVAELSLRFALGNPLTSTVLIGSGSPEHVARNAAAIAKGPLPADVARRLDDIAAQVPYRPFGEAFGLGWHMAAPEKYKGLGPAM